MLNRDRGKEHGNYYSIGLYGDNGKENGNDYQVSSLGPYSSEFRVQGF